MAFYRCGSGGITPAKLYEALQYSGIITENMTSKQMLEALAKRFPDEYDILLNTAQKDISHTLSDKYGEETSFTILNGILCANLTLYGWTEKYECTQNAYSGSFDLTNHSKLTVSFYSNVKHAGDDSRKGSAEIYIEDLATGVQTKLFEHESTGTKDKGNVEKAVEDFVINVEAYSGMHRFHIVNYVNAITVTTEIKKAVLSN